MYSIYQLNQYSGRDQLKSYSSKRHLDQILAVGFKSQKATSPTVAIFSVDIFLHYRKNIELLQFVFVYKPKHSTFSCQLDMTTKIIRLCAYECEIHHRLVSIIDRISQ